MKNRILKISILCASSLLLTSALSSCNKTTNDLTTLNIVCLNKGYGDTWIKNLVSEWERQNPEYKVHLEATSSASTIIQRNINSKNNTDDLYISVGNDWKTYAASNKFLPLDDLIEEEVDGVKIKNKVNKEYQDSIYYTNTNNETHVYRLPWTSGVGGIYYNAKMFDDNGWNIPTTYNELLTLIDTIKNANIPVAGSETDVVKPFVYTGQNTDYFDYAVFTWWAQLAGIDAIKEFLTYSDASVFDYTNSEKAYSKLYEATALWNNIFQDKSNYVEGSAGKTNHQAQQNFLNGYAAMMFNSDWLYNEMINYMDNKTLPSTFDLKIMKTPTAPNAVEPNASYIVGEDQYIAIPKTTQKADLAKSFIKLLVSDYSMKNFLDNAYGLMAYSWDTSTYNSSNTYVNSLLDYRIGLEETYTNYSSSPLYLSGLVDIWSTSAARPFKGLLDGTIASIDAAFITIKNNANDNWSTWLRQAGL
ncbi:MAG: ABC transporter substrate-binding protein [Bacilli bacterium]